MGICLDSSVLVFAERRSSPVSELLESLRVNVGVKEAWISAVSVLELEHGYHRSQSAEQARKRRDYLESILETIEVIPLTVEIARSISKIDATRRAAGIVIPFADLLIGGSAVYFRADIMTRNERHFRMIPGQTVHSMESLRLGTS